MRVSLATRPHMAQDLRGRDHTPRSRDRAETYDPGAGPLLPGIPAAPACWRSTRESDRGLASAAARSDLQSAKVSCASTSLEVSRPVRNPRSEGDFHWASCFPAAVRRGEARQPAGWSTACSPPKRREPRAARASSCKQTAQQMPQRKRARWWRAPAGDCARVGGIHSARTN